MAKHLLGKDWNEFYLIHEPVPVPLQFGGKSFTRLAAKCECRKCGRSFIEVLRLHNVHTDIVTEIAYRKPDMSDEKIMTSFMVMACENGVGCWKTCRPWKHVKVCQMPSRRLILNHDPHACACPPNSKCTCPTGCGNKGIYPCQCGHAFGPHGKHMDGCSVGLYKRHSSFSIEFMRSQLVASRKR